MCIGVRINEFKAKGKGDMKKRIFSVFLAMLIFVAFSLAVFAGDASQPTGAAQGGTGTKGGSVTVNLNVTNNPGIAGAVFKVSFNSDVLTPKKVEAGSIGFDVAAYNTETSGEVTIVLLEVNGENVTSDGTAATVTFDVADDAELGTYDISITCETDNVADEDLQSVNLYTASGSVEIKDYIVGDLDGDMEVTDADAVYLVYYTFRPETYPVNQNCDFNKDDVVNDKDAIYLIYHTFRPDSYPLS